jgi:hypothetical protein
MVDGWKEFTTENASRVYVSGDIVSQDSALEKKNCTKKS